MLIRCIDLETTGFEPPTAEVIEIGYADVFANGPDLAGAPTDWDVEDWDCELVRPERPIPPETSAIHHIVDEDVAEARAFGDVWPQMLSRGATRHAGHLCRAQRKIRAAFPDR